MFTRLRRFFRKPESQPQVPYSGSVLYIAGDLYSRADSGLVVTRWGTKTKEACGPDHIANNGVPIKQIAYAIALIEGSIAISDTIPVVEP